MKRVSKLLSVLAMLALFTLTFATPAYAFDGRTGQDITIQKGEVINDDLYVSAQTFTLNGTVKGDVLVMAQAITINGIVEGDLMAAGQTVVINGTVTGAVRMAGQALQVGGNAQIGSDLIAAGASLETKSSSTVGRDVVVGSAQALMAGDVGRNVLAGTNALEVDGSVGGNVKAYVDASAENQSNPPMSMYMTNIPISIPSVTPGLVVADNAKIAGNLEYSSSVDLPIPSGTVAGKVTRIAIQANESTARHEQTVVGQVSVWALGLLRSLVTLILLGLLLGWLFPKFMNALSGKVQSQPWPSLGWGAITWASYFFALLAVILVMIVGGILFSFLTLGGLSATVIWLGILSLVGLTIAFVLATAYLTKIVVGETLGKWLLGRVNPALAEHKVWPMVTGVALIVLVVGLLNFPLLPLGFFSWLLNFAVILFGLGALWIWGRERLQVRKAA